MATTSSAKRLALGAGITAGTLGVLDHATRAKWPPLRLIIGAATMSAALSALSGPQPELASAFAWLVLITVVLVTGGNVIQRVGHYLDPTIPAPTAAD